MTSPNSFRARINDASWRSAQEAFNLLSGNSAAEQALANRGPNQSDKAFAAASSFATRGLNRISGFHEGLNNALMGETVQHLNAGTQAAGHAQRMEAEREMTAMAKKAADRQNRSNTIGQVVSIAAKVAAFCERRLKINITAINPKAAWDAIRDIPLYAFNYKHQPEHLAYGPMVDEVQAIDPSLLIPMDEEARLAGIADGAPISGIDILKRSAYESAALQLALQRIEALEARINQLEGKPDLRICA